MSVELAVALPVLVVLVFVIIQLGAVFHSYLTLSDAVRDGARRAATRSFGQAEAAAAGVREAAAALDSSKLDCCTVTRSGVRGASITVSASYPYGIELFGLRVHSGTLRSEATERVQRRRLGEEDGRDQERQ